MRLRWNGRVEVSRVQAGGGVGGVWLRLKAESGGEYAGDPGTEQHTWEHTLEVHRVNTAIPVW